MVTTVSPAKRKSQVQGVTYVSRREGAEILDRQARKYLGMSGAEFVRRYRAVEIEDADRTDVLRVAMLIPLAER
jgi:hypothetical protein